MEKRPRVSVVIVNWNAAELLRSCLDSLRIESASEEIETIVLDNASTDDSVKMIRRDYPEVSLIASDENLGFARGNNVAIRETRGEYVFLLNPDTIVQPGCIAKLVGLLDERAEVDIVGPKILQPDGAVQVVCARNFPALATSVFELGLARRLFPHSRIFGRYRMEHWDHQDTRDVPCLLGAAMMIRRSFFERQGFLDEQIPMYFEDIDMCYRVWESGRRICYLSEAEITHFVAQSSSVSRSRISLFVLEQGEAYWLFFRKHRGRFSAGVFTAIMFSGSIYRLLLMSVPLLASPILGDRLRKRIRITSRKYLALFFWSLHSKQPLSVLSRNPFSS